MSSFVFGAAVLAAFVGETSAYSALYDSVHQGCLIPDMAFKGHGAPTPSEMVTISVLSGTTPVTSFTPGEEYTIEVPAYNGAMTNIWVHSTDGTIAPVDATTHATATACMEAGYSTGPAASHSFTWTAPDTADPVTISVAEAASPVDAYKTATLTVSGGDAAAGPTSEASEGAEGSDETATPVEGTAASVSSAVGVATGALAAAAAALAALAL